MSGGGQSQNSTTTNLPLPFVMPYARNYMSDVQGLYNQNSSDPFPNMQTAGFNPDQYAAFSGIEGLGGQVTGMGNSADANMTNTLNGDYLNPSTNPYLAATANAAGQNAVDQYQYATAPGIAGNFLQGGGLGSSAMTSAEDQANFSLGQSLTGMDANIYGGNYANERGNQMTAMGMEPSVAQGNYIPQEALLGIGGQQQTQQQNEFNTNYQNAYQQSQWPYNNLNFLGSAIGQMGNLGGTSNVNMPSMGKGVA